MGRKTHTVLSPLKRPAANAVPPYPQLRHGETCKPFIAAHTCPYETTLQKTARYRRVRHPVPVRHAWHIDLHPGRAT